jgi:hypothetical protein
MSEEAKKKPDERDIEDKDPLFNVPREQIVRLW